MAQLYTRTSLWAGHRGPILLTKMLVPPNPSTTHLRHRTRNMETFLGVAAVWQFCKICLYLEITRAYQGRWLTNDTISEEGRIIMSTIGFGIGKGWQLRAVLNLFIQKKNPRDPPKPIWQVGCSEASCPVCWALELKIRNMSIHKRMGTFVRKNTHSWC